MEDDLDITYLVNYLKHANKSKFAYSVDEDVILAERIYAYSTLAMVPVILMTNSLVFWGMLLYPGFNTPSDLFLFSLSIADFCMGALGIPLYFIKYTESLSFLITNYKYSCIFTFSCRKLAIDGSLWNLLIISIDRYIAVMWPLEYRSLVTSDKAKWLVVFLWTYLIFLATAPLLGLNNYDPSIISDSQRCNYYFVMKRPYVIWSSFITKAICLVIPAILYTQILFVVFKQLRRFEKTSSTMTKQSYNQFQKRITMVKITSTLTFLFILVWAPYLFIAPFKYYKTFPKKNIDIAVMIVKILSTANAMVNAPIYAIGRKEYRNTYRTMLTSLPWKWKEELRNLYVEETSLSLYRASSNQFLPELDKGENDERDNEASVGFDIPGNDVEECSSVIEKEDNTPDSR